MPQELYCFSLRCESVWKALQEVWVGDGSVSSFPPPVLDIAGNGSGGHPSSGFLPQQNGRAVLMGVFEVEGI